MLGRMDQIDLDVVGLSIMNEDLASKSERGEDLG